MGNGLFSPGVVQELIGAVQQLSLARELSAIMRITRGAARRLSRADGATFVLKEGGNCHYADEDAISPLWKGKRFPMDVCISGWVMRRGEAVLIPDVYADPRIAAAAYRPTFVKSMIMVPIRREDPIGAIGAYWAEGRPDAELIEVLQVLADSTSVAMENVRHYQGMRERELRALSLRLSEDEERERRRIAGLLHDDLQQIMVSARLHLQAYEAGPAAKRSLHEAGRLLDEALVKSRRLSLELSPAVLQHSGLAGCLEWLAGRMKEERGLEVRLEASGAADRGFEELKTLLFRAVEELLGNAARHSASSRAAVLLAGGEDELVVEVSDAGRGFDPRLLEPGAPRSAGFGLLTLRERIQAVGGIMEIESAPGRGSRIILRVPRDRQGGAAAEEDAAAGGKRPAEAVPVAAAGDGGCRVLFTDDHQVMRQGLIAMVNGQPDIRVVGEAANGREALEMARRLRPDVIVMDVSMPVMDGMEATRLIKAELPGIRIIGLSMHNDEQLARTMRRSGAEAFLCKTEPLDRLLSAIRGTELKAG